MASGANWAPHIAVRLDNPLKQGLKLDSLEGDAAVAPRPPGQSIKTRVEAYRKAAGADRDRGPPGQSIKTRVEAPLSAWACAGPPVRLDNPLKQGLKLELVPGTLTRRRSAWTIH